MRAIHNIPYGLYVLTVKGERFNGCIINTLQQVTSNPEKISITVNKENFTTKIIEETKEFNVSILDMSTTFDVIKKFGFASGKDVDKFESFQEYAISKNGLPYITSHTNSYISAKVVSSIDVGTHITFIAEIVEDVVLSQTESVTYAYYLKNIKPAAQAKNKYVCLICSYVYEGGTLPQDFVCPICKHGADVFELQE